MKKVLPFLLALCLLTLAACVSAENPKPTGTLPTTQSPTESTAAAETTEDTQATTAPATEPPTVPTTEGTTSPPEVSALSYLVEILRTDFPIHSGPGYDYPQTTTVKVATLYTIVEEFWDSEGNLWGKLKSGAGWVDLSLNAKEAGSMPPVTVSRADPQLLAGGNYHYCSADSSEYAYEAAFQAHEPLTNVSFFVIEVAETYKRGPNLLYLPLWEPGKPLVASVSFPGSASTYGLEFTDSHGVTHIYSVWESGRNGSIGISPFPHPLVPADPAPEAGTLNCYALYCAETGLSFLSN